jgi:rubrerythrin
LNKKEEFKIMEVLSKIISLLLVAVLISLLPLQYLFEHQLRLFNTYSEDEVIRLVEEMREKRYLDVDMYEEFLKKLSVTGVIYDIELEHAIPKAGSDMTRIEELPGVFVASSQLEHLPSISSFATHTHTDNCYAGHNHIASGCVKGYSCHPNASIYVSYIYSSMKEFICTACNTVIARVTFSSSSQQYNYHVFGMRMKKSTQKYELVSLVSYRYMYLRPETSEGDARARAAYNSITGNYSITDVFNLFPVLSADAAAFQSTTHVIEAPYSCNITTIDNNPICAQVVESITATNPSQTINKGDSIMTTATATYLDGHTGVVNCTSNFNPNQIGAQTVTLTYSGLVGNAKTTGSRTCTVNVTVRETNIPSYLTVTPSSNDVYNGTEPYYTVVVTYMNGNTKTITSGYTKTGWSTGYGMKTVVFSYTENGKTVMCSIIINVKPNIVSIEVTPAQQTVERYKEPYFTVKAWYEDGAYSYVSSYTTSGFNKNNISTQSVTIQYKENLITRSSNVRVTVTPMKVICPQCGNGYFLDENDFDQGCPICKTTVTSIQVAPTYITVARNEPLGICVTATFADGHTEEVTGWTSNYDSSKGGIQLVMVTYAGKYAFVNVNVVDKKICSICGNAYSFNEDGTDPGCPICKEFLVSISASPDHQILEQGEDILLTVTGKFRDGHSATVLGWSSNYDRDLAGEQQITVYYRNLTCSVRVSVVSEDKVQCSICGTFYNYRDDPWGCPICAGTITQIEAKLLSGGTRTSFGAVLELAIILFYRDGHREMVYGGWQDNFDPFQLGMQEVIITYSDIFNNSSSCKLTVNVVNTLTQVECENGHLYYAEDGECPYCAADNGAGICIYSDCHFTDEILEVLYDKGIYNFAEGDYVSIKVILRTEGSIYSMGLFRKKEGVTPITYGGEVA